MNENGVHYFTVMHPNEIVMPSPLPWFQYSNLQQRITISFIKPALSQSVLSRCTVIRKVVNSKHAARGPRQRLSKLYIYIYIRKV